MTSLAALALSFLKLLPYFLGLIKYVTCDNFLLVCGACKQALPRAAHNTLPPDDIPQWRNISNMLSTSTESKAFLKNR